VLKIVLATLLYGIFFGSVELLSKQLTFSKENSRKLVHIIAGVTAAGLCLWLSFHQIVIVSLLFIPVMVLSKRLNFFSSIHQVARTTYGEVYFPVAICIEALLFPHRALYIYGLLIMALSDGLASVLGQRYGKQTYKIWASQKSYLGSTVFLVLAILIGLVTLVTLGASYLQAVLFSITLAALLTLGEAALSYGLDNLILPPVASFLLWSVVELLQLK
jgi:phytol kinase